MKKIDIIVPISGGKDSQACLKLAKESGKKIIGLFCDTMYEHPLTYAHIENIRKLYDVDIHTLRNGKTPLDLSIENKRFPSDAARFCTDKLKIRETRIFLDSYSQEHGAVEVWYGMRSDESHARRIRYVDKTSDMPFFPHELMRKKYPKKLGKRGVVFKLPILEWSTAEVFHFLNGEENPLYKAGFDRVGCFPCLAAGDVAKSKAFGFDKFGEDQRIDVKIVEKKIGKTLWTGKKGRLINNNEKQGCLLCAI